MLVEQMVGRMVGKMVLQWDSLRVEKMVGRGEKTVGT
jgi:hypothetical protein